MSLLMPYSDYLVLLHVQEQCGVMIEDLEDELRRAGMAIACEKDPAEVSKRIRIYNEIRDDLESYNKDMRRITKSIQWEDFKMSVRDFGMRIRRITGGLI